MCFDGWVEHGKTSLNDVLLLIRALFARSPREYALRHLLISLQSLPFTDSTSHTHFASHTLHIEKCCNLSCFKSFLDLKVRDRLPCATWDTHPNYVYSLLNASIEENYLRIHRWPSLYLDVRVLRCRIPFPSLKTERSFSSSDKCFNSTWLSWWGSGKCRWRKKTWAKYSQLCLGRCCWTAEVAEGVNAWQWQHGGIHFISQKDLSFDSNTSTSCSSSTITTSPPVESSHQFPHQNLLPQC